jgi:hypothetical protein
MPLGPAQVHPEQHLCPVGRLGAAGAGTDREERAALVVLAGEQQLRPRAAEVGGQGGALAVQLGRQLAVARLVDELEGRQEVVGARQQSAPGVDLGSEGVGGAKSLLRRTLVIPEIGGGGAPVELGELALFAS